MRKHRKSTAKLLLATIVLTVGMGMTAYAADWKQDTTGWQYEQDGGGYATGWNWIDGKCYYFADNGYMLANTEVDGYTLNTDGQWTVNGIVQTQGAGAETGYNENGISNIAIDLLEHTRAENAAKYGEIGAEDMAQYVIVTYQNCGFMVYYNDTDLNGKPHRVWSYMDKASDLFRDAPMTGNADTDKNSLKNKGYSTVSDGIDNVVDCGRYELQLQSYGKNANVYIKFSYR